MIRNPGNCPANVYLRRPGERTFFDGVSTTVGPPCAIKTGGLWYCEAHALKFTSDLASVAHTRDITPHVLVWICPVHGPESPGE